MGRLQEMLKVGPVFSYFGRVFRKDKDGKYPASTNLKMMHGINKISIILFLIAVIVMIFRAITRE
jgi:hypothetical protein